MDSYIGWLLSIEMGGGLGFYQGEVVQVDTDRQTLTLTKVLHNGKPTSLKTITLNAGDIRQLQILSKTKEGLQAESNSKETPNHPKAKQTEESSNENSESSNNQTQRRKQRSVGETLAHASHSTEKSSNDNKSQPIEVINSMMNQATLNKDASKENQSNFNHYSHRQPYECGSPRKNDFYRNQNNSNKKDRYMNMRKSRDDATFGIPIDDDFLNTEFDFEKNLALFDKQAIVGGVQKKTKKNYHHTENVIPGKSNGSSTCQSQSQITVPASGAAELLYATDDGQLVPSVTGEFRTTILSTANQHGLTNSRQLETIGRGATELILSLIGASHRLDPVNRHQAPVVVILCGGHMQGAAGVNTARQLECHGVRTKVITPLLPTSPPASLLLSHELQLYNLTNGQVNTNTQSIRDNLDLIVDARLDQSGQIENIGTSSSNDWYLNTTMWASKCRAPVLALDPPSDLSPGQTMSVLPARILLCVALPLAYTPTRGKVYLLNLPIPQQTYNSIGIKYTPPFGSKLVIPLHPCE